MGIYLIKGSWGVLWDTANLDEPNRITRGGVEEAHNAVSDGHYSSKYTLNDVAERYVKIYGLAVLEKYRNPAACYLEFWKLFYVIFYYWIKTGKIIT